MLPTDGTVLTSKGDLYVVPTGMKGTIHAIHVSNSSGSARTATVYANLSGTSRAISPMSMALAADATAVYVADLKLRELQKIEGIASGSGVNFVICGEEARL